MDLFSNEELQQPFGRLASVALPRLLDVVVGCERLAQDVFGRNITYTVDDSADRMALSFVTKQLEHLRSVRVLLGARQHRDAYLLSRVMIEGLAKLIWAFNDRPERTDRWFWFSAIVDWRQMIKNERDGILVDQDEKAQLSELVEEYGPQYVKDELRKKEEEARLDGIEFRLPDDPWAKEWLPKGMSMESIFVELKNKRLYDTGYRPISDWIHWNPRAINGAINTDLEITWFTSVDWHAAITSLLFGTQSVTGCFQILDSQFDLGVTPRIDDLLDAIERSLQMDPS